MKDNEGQREKQGRKKPALLAQDDKQHRGENMQKYAEPKDALSAQVKENLTQDQRHGHQGRGSSGRHRTAN